jgi:hypothetical protein
MEKVHVVANSKFLWKQEMFNTNWFKDDCFFLNSGIVAAGWARVQANAVMWCYSPQYVHRYETKDYWHQWKNESGCWSRWVLDNRVP